MFLILMLSTLLFPAPSIAQDFHCAEPTLKRYYGSNGEYMSSKLAVLAQSVTSYSYYGSVDDETIEISEMRVLDNGNVEYFFSMIHYNWQTREYFRFVVDSDCRFVEGEVTAGKYKGRKLSAYDSSWGH